MPKTLFEKIWEAHVVAEMEGGGRFFGQLAAAPPGPVHAGMPVRLVLRRLHDGGGLAHYFWKLLPTEEAS